MKNYIPLCMLCGALFFASCDDSTTKNEANKEAVYYEMAFHRYALENETEDTQNRLAQTEQEIEQNCKGEEDMSETCQQLRKRRDSLELKLNSIQKKMKLLANIELPEIPELPDPQPCPGEATCIPNLDALLVMDQIGKIDISFIGENGKAFNPVENIVQESGYPGFIKHEFMDLSGNYTMKVKKDSPALGGEIQYEIDIAIQETPK